MSGSAESVGYPAELLASLPSVACDAFAGVSNISLEKLWPGDTFVDFDESLNTAIKKLRYALGDSPENPTFIETTPAAAIDSLRR